MTSCLKIILTEINASQNPTLFQKIDKYFESGPNLVQIPELRWNEDVVLDEASLGYLTFNDIQKAHESVNRKTFFGLKKISNLIIEGVSDSENYLVRCENFENMLSRLYKGLIYKIANFVASVSCLDNFSVKTFLIICGL